MAFVAAKCTECGASIEVDDSKEAGICRHCGTAFVTQKVINTHNTYVTQNITKNFYGNEKTDYLSGNELPLVQSRFMIQDKVNSAILKMVFSRSKKFIAYCGITMLILWACLFVFAVFLILPNGFSSSWMVLILTALFLFSRLRSHFMGNF